MIPAPFVNFSIRILAPNVIKRIHKNTLGYKKWKSKHNPDFLPWINEWQIPCPKIDWNHVKVCDKSPKKI